MPTFKWPIYFWQKNKGMNENSGLSLTFSSHDFKSKQK